tara:strand:- start:378 stop:1190 length:813 start_codon:yes stop_codon:yes gene_type:complete
MNKKNFNQKWDIPNYKLVFYKKKKKDFLLVIPVINESYRLHFLLEKLNKLKIKNKVDIIICDGGSTDDTININKFLSLKVDGLIIKKGKGKLSSQLRCAYSFGIKKNYKGIITIDGNGKDDPKMIFKIISKLKKGYDFVQASRFLKGASHKNTPILRLLGIRLIHSPLLSLFSGFHWTDTTQGFRGYNSKILIDKKVKPFRKIFNSYELLFYLSYITPKLGYKCCEIPSKRIYPKNFNPTKISFVKGNLSILITLIKVCLGFYNPKNKHN